MTTDLKVGDIVVCKDEFYSDIRFEGIIRGIENGTVAVEVTDPLIWRGHSCRGAVTNSTGRWFLKNLCTLKGRTKRKSGFGTFIVEQQL